MEQISFCMLTMREQTMLSHQHLVLIGVGNMVAWLHSDHICYSGNRWMLVTARWKDLASDHGGARIWPQ